MPTTVHEEPPGPGRGVITPLIIVAVLVALAFGGAAYGANRTQDGIKEAAARKAAATTTIAPVKGPPKAKPVPAAGKVEGPTPCPNPDGSSPRADLFAQAPPTCIDPKKTYVATFDTTAGTIVAKLDAAKTTATNNFVVLARYHYYDGSAIFQTQPRIDAVIGGNPKTQTSADPGPGYTITEVPPGGKEVDPASGQPKGVYTYTTGDLAMAPASGAESPYAFASAFFFAAGPNSSLLDRDGYYVPFGKVTSGQDLLQKVLATHVACPPTDQECQGGAPDPVVIVKTITIQET
jgi:cyclophilin family peptidyl-prolyl cis-trans isomerase